MVVRDARETVGATAPTVRRRPHRHCVTVSAEAMPASMRHYRVRLRRSRRLPYRIARLLPLALAFGLLIVVYLARH